MKDPIDAWTVYTTELPDPEELKGTVSIKQKQLVGTSNLHVHDWKWFNGRDCVGIVLCEDVVTGTKKCYIGVGNGVSETADVEHIALHGAKFPVEIAEQLLNV